MLTVPFVADLNFVLVYPLVFLITTVSLFFRPAKTAVVPRIVEERDVLAANSAVWTADTLADIAGYPLAGVFVYFLGTRWRWRSLVDSATYLASAVLIASITIPPVVRKVAPAAGGAVRGFLNELSEGWRFLRARPALFQNTIISDAGAGIAGRDVGADFVSRKGVARAIDGCPTRPTTPPSTRRLAWATWWAGWRSARLAPGCARAGWSWWASSSSASRRSPSG